MTDERALPYGLTAEDLVFDPATLERYDRIHNEWGPGAPGGSETRVDAEFCRDTLLSLADAVKWRASDSATDPGTGPAGAADRVLDAARHMLHRATEDMTGAELTMLFGRLPSGGALLAACLDTALVWEVG